jgi:XTP/dITP diphosphohydrolase
LIPSSISLIGLTDINCTEEIPETHPTIEGNASQKAFYIYNNYQINCFADDTGLEVEALDGAPGVLSARYAGESKNAEENMNKILAEMQGITDRKARFKTVISLVMDGKETQFEGIINGTILTEKHGAKGFGYDPIFAPISIEISPSVRQKSFAEMDLTEKNKISHRALAVNKLVEYLNQIS